MSTIMMTSWSATKKRNIIWPWKCKSRSPFTKENAVSQLLYDRFLTKFYRNDGNVVGNKNIISADLENVDQIIISRLLYSLFEPNFHRNDATGADKQKRHISWPLKCRSRSHFISAVINWFEPNFLQEWWCR